VDDPKGHWQVVPNAEDYDRGRFGSLWGRVYRWREERAIRQAIRPLARTGKILDAACGTGRVTSLLVGEGFRGVVASDVSLAMMTVAHRHLSHVPFFQSDVTSLPFEGATFDAVTCVGLLMHLDAETRLRALAELARISRRFLVIQYGCMSPLTRVVTRVTGRGAPGGVRHTIQEAEMRRDLERVGLRERARFWTLRPVSTSVILLLSK
jgi:SAM-dependent methyltransferase